MPFISLHTNLALDAAQEQALAQELSSLAASILGKPEQWVMTQIVSTQSMSFAGNSAPCAYLECKSIDLDDSRIPRLAEELCTLLHHKAQLDPARIYIEFTSAQAHQWGWNGATF